MIELKGKGLIFLSSNTATSNWPATNYITFPTVLVEVESGKNRVV